MSRFTVIYDSCVLYPAPLRDLLIQLATADLFRAKWTERIHREWMSSLLTKRPDLQLTRLERTRDLMNESVLDCLVAGYEYLVSEISLPDDKDRHVVAAAIHAKADAIVTFNLKDFPPAELSKYNLEAIHPDDFITYQIDLDKAAVLIACQRCLRRLKNPPLTAEQYLDGLQALSLPKSAAALRAYAPILGS